MRAATSLSWLTVTIVAISGLTPTLEGGVEPTQRSSPPIAETRVMPAAGSALAASNDAVFAIAADGRQILTRPADLSGPWRVLQVEGQFSRLRGLAINGRDLFASDSGDEAVYHIELATGRRTTLFEEGPLRNPGSLAVARDVFVTDDLTFKLYRIRNGQVREIALEKDKNVGKDKPLSARGLRRRSVRFFTRRSDLRVPRSRARRSRAVPVASADFRRHLSRETFTGTAGLHASEAGVPGHRPAIRHRNLERCRLCRRQQAAERLRVQPSRSAAGQAGAWPGLEASNSQQPHGQRRGLYILHGNELQRWPRLIPAEVHLRLVSVSESMSRVYEYLRERDILPVKRVAVRTEHRIHAQTESRHPRRLPGNPRSLAVSAESWRV